MFRPILNRTGYRIRWYHQPFVDPSGLRVPAFHVSTESKIIHIGYPFHHPDMTTKQIRTNLINYTIHELCHVLMATPEEREMRNLGLPGNMSGIPAQGDSRIQETNASWLHVVVREWIERPRRKPSHIPYAVSVMRDGDIKRSFREWMEDPGCFFPLPQEDWGKAVARIPDIRVIHSIVSDFQEGMRYWPKG